MQRLHKMGRHMVVLIALSVSTWLILATAYLSIYGSVGRFEWVKEELIDFRIIVLTFSRSESLLKALRSMDELELDGDRAVLEIWIDRSKSGQVDERTVRVAQSFNWTRGQTRVHIQRTHAGIRGQWIDSWQPTNDRELAVIVEDDLSLSKYAYRWIKAVHAFYGKRDDFAGTSLTSDQVVSHHVSRVVQLKAPKNETVFMYSCVGSWGFSPKPVVWRRFQAWYHSHVNDANFHPYVDGILPTRWYKAMERSKTSSSVWTQWFIYFAEMEKLYTIYNNLPTHVGDRNSCLSINRREVGLHVRKKGREDLCKLLNRWNESFVGFSENITKLNWAGRNVLEIDAHERSSSRPSLSLRGKKVVDRDVHKRLTSRPIIAASKKDTKLGFRGRNAAEKDVHQRPISQPIDSTSKKVIKLRLPDRKAAKILNKSSTSNLNMYHRI